MTLENSLAKSPHRPQTARWRWWVALLLIAGVPLVGAFFSAQRMERMAGGKAGFLPTDVPQLLRYTGVHLGVFALLWAVFWAFSRANRDQLFLRYRGVKSLAWGVAYSVLMRFAIGFAVIFVLAVLAMLGFDPQKVISPLEKTGEVMKEIVVPALSSRDPVYKFLLITLISFVVAGLREELWRAAILASLLRLAPASWSQKRKNGVALGASSVLFGCAHLYQGAAGVVGTTLLGLVLGLVMLRHQSVYPAIIAHGCFNAASFAALAALSNGK